MKVLLYWSPTLLYMIIIFYSSSIPGKDVQLPVSDVLIHLGEYAILMFLILFSFSRGLVRRVPGSIYLSAFLITFLYGFSDELHQSFTPGRNPSIKDLAVDGAAALLALGLHLGISRIRWDESVFPR